jgi:hypothetical protein
MHCCGLSARSITAELHYVLWLQLLTAAAARHSGASWLLFDLHLMMISKQVPFQERRLPCFTSNNVSQRAQTSVVV